MDDHVTLVKKDGQRFENIPSTVTPAKIIIDNAAVPIEEGDFFERALPNGLTERYLVLDRGFYKGLHSIPDHYQVSVRKETAISSQKQSSGPVIYNVTGPNARVNINSTDMSGNVVNVTSETLFVQLRQAVEGAVANPDRRSTILKTVDEMEQAAGSRTFGEKYRAFISSAADHITVLSPFIPALTQMLGG
jgi:hypothetical protein